MSTHYHYCRYCLEADLPAVVRSWVSGCQYHLDISGCPSCQSRHEKQVMALQAELRLVRAAFAESEGNHQIELSRITAESSLALMNKSAEYEQLLSEVNRVKAENLSQGRMVQFLKLRGVVPTWLVRKLNGSTVPIYAAVVLSVVAAKSRRVQELLASSETGMKTAQELFSCTNTYPVFRQITDFCHSGELTFSKFVRPDAVLRVAHCLEIGFLKQFCEAELCRQLTVDNVPQMLKLARTCAAPKLQQEAETLFREHFDMLKAKVFDVLEGLDDGSDDGSEEAHDVSKGPDLTS